MLANTTRIKKSISKLKKSMESTHFRAHFNTYNSKHGQGRSSDCVRGNLWVLTCLDAAERLYETMLHPPWNRPHPIKTGEKVQIYLLNLLECMSTSYPFAFPDPHGKPFVCLPCQSGEPTVREALQFISAATIHEVTHVFNFSQWPSDPFAVRPWLWFDEGFSVFMEHLVMWGNQNYFQYLKQWVDYPEFSMHYESSFYQAVMFIAYLAKKKGIPVCQ